jgi:uncharacterized protein DUF6969
MSVKLAGIAPARLELMAVAGAELATVERAFARQETSVVGRLLRDEGTFFEWDHFPAGDIYDPVSGAQYFYHAHGSAPKTVGAEGKFHNLMPPAHSGAQRHASEHGHFHTFLRPAGSDIPCHVVAIAMDYHGRPNRLFTVNRWVTEEGWADAPHLIGILERFAIDLPRPSRWVNRWLAALLRLFRPQIEDLLRQRDQTIAVWARRHPGIDPYGARELEILSQLDISLAAQIDAVARALARPRRKTR